MSLPIFAEHFGKDSITFPQPGYGKGAVLRLRAPGSRAGSGLPSAQRPKALRVPRSLREASFTVRTLKGLWL